MLIDPPDADTRRGRFPFDRIGVLALVWAGVFVLTAVGLAILFG